MGIADPFHQEETLVELILYAVANLAPFLIRDAETEVENLYVEDNPRRLTTGAVAAFTNKQHQTKSI